MSSSNETNPYAPSRVGAVNRRPGRPHVLEAALAAAVTGIALLRKLENAHGRAP